MASLLLAQPTFLARRSPYSSLLNLDCSADLSSYSRNLGPTVPPRSPALSSEMLRQQFEGHREMLLRTRQAQNAAPAQPQTQNQNQTQTHMYSNSIAPAQQQQQHYYPDPRASAQNTTPQQFGFRQPAAPARAERSPSPGKLDTYPRELREALEESARNNGARGNENAIYHVVEDLDSDYMDDSSDVIGTYRNVHTANLKAAEQMVEGGYLESDDESELRVSIGEDGNLWMQTATEGSTGGRVSIYVRRGELR